jgi:hypothetical protein
MKTKEFDNMTLGTSVNAEFNASHEPAHGRASVLTSKHLPGTNSLAYLVSPSATKTKEFDNIES